MGAVETEAPPGGVDLAVRVPGWCHLASLRLTEAQTAASVAAALGNQPPPLPYKGATQGTSPNRSARVET